MPEFQSGPWSLVWEHIGEGHNGDYDLSDPNDAPLLRADLFFNGTRCEDGSYCTLAPDNTPREKLSAFSDALFDRLADDADVREDDGEVRFNSRIMQRWTWDTDPAKGEASVGS